MVGDLVRRKNLMAAGSAIKAAAFLSWLVLPSFWGFALGFVLWALGDAARSGTAESLLHDGLAELGESEQFEKVYGRIEAAEGVGVILAVALGGLAAEGGYTLPLLLSGVAPLVAAGLTLALVREPPRTNEEEDADFSTTLSVGVRALLTSRTIATLVGMLTLLATAPGILEEYVGPLLEADGFSLTGVGLVAAVIWGARTIGVVIAHRQRAPGLPRIALLFAAGHAVLLAIVLPGPVVLVVALSLYYLLVGAAEVLQQGALQRSIDSHARATITSLGGMSAEVWSIVLFLSVGLIADAHGWITAFTVVAALTLVSSLLLAVVSRGMVVPGEE